MQQATRRLDELFAAGCLDRRVESLPEQIDSLTDGGHDLSILSDKEFDTFRSLTPLFKQMCHELAAYSIPHTLVHGDLHSGNVSRKDDKFVYFDWTDACVSHPFFDLSILIDYEAPQRDGPLAGHHLLSTYFSVWTEYEPIERLWQAWELARPLAALHQAVSYRYILMGQDKTSTVDIISGYPMWIRRALRALPDLTMSY